MSSKKTILNKMKILKNEKYNIVSLVHTMQRDERI